MLLFALVVPGAVGSTRERVSLNKYINMSKSSSISLSVLLLAFAEASLLTFWQRVDHFDTRNKDAFLQVGKLTYRILIYFII